MTPRITYNSIDIDLIQGRNGIQPIHRQSRNENVSGSGKTETINLYGSQEISYDAYFSRAKARDLMAFWSWSRQGKAFSFAADNTKTGSTIIVAASASGTTSISLGTSGAFTTGDICLLRAEDSDDEFEIITINSTTATSIGTSTTLKYSYNIGDLLRHWEYWPVMLNLDEEFSPRRVGQISTSVDRYYHHTFRFKEDL